MARGGPRGHPRGGCGASSTAICLHLVAWVFAAGGGPGRRARPFGGRARRPEARHEAASAGHLRRGARGRAGAAVRCSSCWSQRSHSPRSVCGAGGGAERGWWIWLRAGLLGAYQTRYARAAYTGVVSANLEVAAPSLEPETITICTYALFFFCLCRVLSSFFLFGSLFVAEFCPLVFIEQCLSFGISKE